MRTREVILTTVLALCMTFLAGAETKKLTVDDVLFLKSLDVEEATILKKVQESGTTFSAEDIEKLKEGGLSGNFLSKVQQPVEVKPKGPKLTVENVVLLKDFGIPEATILQKVKDSGSRFSAGDLEQLKKAGLSDDFIAKLGAGPEEEKEKPEKVDPAKAAKKFREDVDELGDCVEPAAKALEKFDETHHKLTSLKEAGVLSDEEFALALEKAGKTCGEAIEDYHAKALELKKVIDEAPFLKEKKAGVDLASYCDQYLAALKEVVKKAGAVAEGKAKPDELEKARAAASDLKTKVVVSFDLFAAITKEEPEKKEEKEKKEEPAEKGLAGSWQLKAPGIKVDLVLGDDGKFSWHYEAADETEDLKGTWKKADESTIEIQGEGDPTKSLMPCKLIEPDKLQITVEGVILQFNRVGEKNRKGVKKDRGGKREASDDSLDLSSPEAAVTTFIRGCQAKDLDLLSQCMSEITEEELKPLKDKTASSKMLDELASMFRGATIESVDKPADTGAIVKVKLKPPRREEQIFVYKEEGCWKLQEF